MITPAEIVKKAERKYHAVLRAYLNDDDLFPLEFPVGRSSKNLVERRQQIDDLRQRSKEITGQGYALEWQTINQRDLGKQTTPRRVVIENLEDYLAVVRKRTDYQQFVNDVERIRRRMPALENWLLANPLDVIEYSGQWDDLLTVCDYFVKHSCPNVYIRELPIPVHTKFIEQHSRILRDLLDALLPVEAVNTDAKDFTERFGLKAPPHTIRLRLLEEQLDWQYDLRLDDLTLPVDQLAHLLAEHIQPKTVIIAENMMNFLTLPQTPNSIGLFGRGFAVQLLANVEWLHQCRVIYWGDIDAHGFQILSDLRQLFPHVQSVMMDQQTLDDHAEYAVAGNRVGVRRFDGLTEAEAIVARHVLEHNVRVEQEHIPQAYAHIRLDHILRFSGTSTA
jgi:hypothetical protein